ncbi:cupin domain-containing protein [Salinarchaeum sp. Harcht-Bsk1]|uniref:cupin domain-containing protein n=1 Tax=Salinarchaeum sp. Harcht-Bsk1 TaxID=1333523 RepID=UPI0003424408|nr:cupin domain-containing protein [Salinarchaeum sp. Harcht-Bsk1]AGN00051.1 cupin domain-containing protein [Salinarchaeum sp. Harcht-Bsk1]
MSPSVVALDELDAEPHAVLFDDEPKTIRLRLESGEEIAAHSHPDRQIVFHLLSGSIVVTLDGEEHTLEPGDVARFDGERAVSPRAREDSTALIVLAQKSGA